MAMRRREFIAALGGAAAWPVVAQHEALADAQKIVAIWGAR